jgi:hypothetical protein
MGLLYFLRFFHFLVICGSLLKVCHKKQENGKCFQRYEHDQTTKVRLPLKGNLLIARLTALKRALAYFPFTGVHVTHLAWRQLYRLVGWHL